MPTPDNFRFDELITVRDWLRYATSEFTKHGLVFGHGTAAATDEAAYLILHTLHLPIDLLEPWLDCRLTRPERERIAAILDRRIATRKPAPYLTNAAWIKGHRFYVDERVIVPRSLIGELLCDGLPGVIGDARAVEQVLDLCTGSGCLAILAALAFPEARVDATDISQDALEVARRNVADYGLEERVRLVETDLFPGEAARYDLILANPPYVGAEAMAAFPPEYRAEPAIAHAGGADGLDIVRRILEGAGRYLRPDGHLVVEIGGAADKLEQEFPKLPFLWLDTEDTEREIFALPASALR
jgi:ribosomal protein L3 glutamine methyltransferase